MKKELILTICCYYITLGYSQTLQAVTDQGNITTNPITIQGNSFTVSSGPTTTGGYSGIQISPSGNNDNGGYTALNSFYSGLAWSSPLVLQNLGTGKVGIGTNNPGAKLTIVKDGTDPVGYDDNKTLFVSGLYGSGQQYDGGIEFRHDNLTQGIGFGYNTIYQTGSNVNQELNLIAKGDGPITLNGVGGASGNVGVGVTNPAYKLDVVNKMRVGAQGGNDFTLIGGGTGVGSSVQLFFADGAENTRLMGNNDSWLNAVTGNLGIGTTTPTEKLSVNGKIRAKEIKVEASPWPDYVFHSSYKLPDLKDTEQFIKENKHLPEIPSAAEVEKDGVSLGEMNAKLLKKIEELTLYIIDLKKENTDVKDRLSALEKRIKP